MIVSFTGVRDFIMDDKSWVIHGLVVETGDWFSGEEILVPQD